MSPSANSRTEVANASYSAASFASVFAVLTSFDSVIKSNIHEPEELEDIVHCTGGPGKLKDLALLLLAAAADKKANAKLADEHWPRLCSELASGSVDILKKLEVPEDIADSIDNYLGHNVVVRVDVLYWLCELAVMVNSSIKALVDREAAKVRKPSTAESAKETLVRLQPFAEIAKQRYWLFGNKTRQLYLESTSQRSKGKFELVAQTPDEFTHAAEELRSQRTHAHKELADRMVEEIVPFLEIQARKRERVEKALHRQALALANVHIYETRTRKRQRINYNVDDNLASLDF
ncbi:hypothetical protein GGI25_003193 [Coemansia spiralis]|uniref:Uncharacterized protein n=2 Tax=Coemansia TaxID=4863 RepID=A0A9W8G2I0_9FUNG|nr:hypothetical protein BX070DRAFT_253009 [Coemansia spiralis]KAJ1991832.1 hypothetical protein EDC05_003187 [Coemansia umbellata]KAJ2621883.1 hypothetical protein GGI26_003726 [Coemansia sp. RSA 1358]KAJ2677438.1 hypothetical protein GGI25_003193 [Coemansia spiralis]